MTRELLLFISCHGNRFGPIIVIVGYENFIIFSVLEKIQNFSVLWTKEATEIVFISGILSLYDMQYLFHIF